MTERFLINATHATDDPDRATIALVMANAALSLGKDAVLLLVSEGARLAVPAVVDAIREPGFATLRELFDQFLESGGQVWACSPCVAKRGLASEIDPRVTLTGAVAALAWVADNGSSLSF